MNSRSNIKEKRLYMPEDGLILSEIAVLSGYELFLANARDTFLIRLLNVKKRLLHVINNIMVQSISRSILINNI